MISEKSVLQRHMRTQAFADALQVCSCIRRKRDTMMAKAKQQQVIEARGANLSSVCGCGAAYPAGRQRPELVQHPENAGFACTQRKWPQVNVMMRVVKGDKSQHVSDMRSRSVAGAHRCRWAP